jgi:acetylornithine/N-succinyldiaminopimelate aminotransferase
MHTTDDAFSALKGRADKALLPTYARFPVAYVRGEGRYLFDTSGKRYVDFAGGIAVNSLGHAHPRMVETLSAQASKLIHISNLYYSEPMTRLAERLDKLFGGGRCFFSNSGAEANEGLFKMARRFGQESGRYEIITCLNSFHGRTLGGIAATGQEKIKKGFYPIVPGFHHVPFNDLSAVEAAITEKTAAVMIEGIQGEGGITPATPEFLLGLRRLCDEKGILLLFDAVQCGHFRTGCFQSYQRILEGINNASFIPDAVSFAKSLGGGFPIGGFWLPEHRASLFDAGSHGTTYGGSPLACAVANTVLDVIEDEGLIENVRKTGSFLREQLSLLRDEYPQIVSEVRGYGFMLGLQLVAGAPALKDDTLTPAQVVINRLLRQGLLVVPSGTAVLRFLPPLNTTGAEVEEAIAILRQTLESFGN